MAQPSLGERASFLGVGGGSAWPTAAFIWHLALQWSQITLVSSSDTEQGWAIDTATCTRRKPLIRKPLIEPAGCHWETLAQMLRCLISLSLKEVQPLGMVNGELQALRKIK